ncbi:MAG: TonB-dependent receptor [Bacteroides sp.]|nr:TonB-dependent receptor [Bacteroides sp.]MCI1682207.1 TonB-dependent receptor [Bacteroides sp.]
MRLEFILRKSRKPLGIGTLVFLLLTMLTSPIIGSEQMPLLSIHMNGSIKDALYIIEKESNFVFIYSDDISKDLNEKIALKIKKERLDKILDQILTPKKLLYRIHERQISILKSAAVQQQDKSGTLKVTGRVVDEKGEPLIGVSIQEVGTYNGVTTDVNGFYTLYNVTGAESTLKFTYIGYVPQNIKVGSQRQINITLQPDTKNLEEVVVVGYGTQKRASVVGAITTIKPATLQMDQTRSLTNALAGSVSGIIAVQRSGEPGSDASDFWIRGISTFSSVASNPLVLVDGIERDIDNISPEEIESFSVLKDATATAVYGVKGANGVILIQTKHGKIGKPRIAIKADYGISTPTKLPKFIDGATYMEVMNIASQLTSGKDMYTQDAINATRNRADLDLYPNVNWLNSVTKDYVPNGRISLDINGGSERLRYSMVASYFGEKGITVTDPSVDYDASNKLSRYNIRTNLDMNLTPSTLINVSVGGYITNKREPGWTPTDILYLAFKNTPICYPKIYSNGQIPTYTSQTNPWAAATHTGFVTTNSSSIQSEFVLTQDIGKLWKPLDGLKAKGTFSFDSYAWDSFIRKKVQTTYMATGRDEEGNLITTMTNQGNNFLGYSKSNGGNRSLYFEGQLNYSKLIAENHQIDALLLYNMRDYVNADATTSIYSLPYRSQGLAGRISYGLKGTYFLEANFGYNGSENFAPGKKWGFFPSVAAGWLISNESFMKKLSSTISKLKLRASYGLVGNDQLAGRRFAFLSTISSIDGYSFGASGDNAYNGYTEGEFGVNNLTWETVKKFDLGLEIGLWDCLNIQADYFHEKHEKIFMQRKTIPETAGFTSAPWANYGVVTNQGCEFSLEMNKEFNKNLFLSVRGSFTYAHNKIIEYDEPEALKETTRSHTGNSIGTYYGLEAVGVFQEEDFLADGSLKSSIPRHTFGAVHPGDIRYADTNHDGKVDANDYKPIGKPYNPEIVYGLGFSIRYKNIDFSTFFQGDAHCSTMLSGDLLIPGSGGGGLGNIYTNWDDRWNPANPYRKDVFWPRFSTTKSINNNLPSTWWLKDASYIRLKNLEIGYTLPKNWQKTTRMRGARVFFRGSNLWTWSAFNMWDPEVGSSDGLKYPPMKVYSLGFQVTF